MQQRFAEADAHYHTAPPVRARLNNLAHRWPARARLFLAKIRISADILTYNNEDSEDDVQTGLMALVLAGLLSGCTAPSQHAAEETCPADNQMQQTTLYFGLSRPPGRDHRKSGSSLLTGRDAALSRWLTVFDARGQWLGTTVKWRGAEQGADADPR
jgi:hypothetical protein